MFRGKTTIVVGAGAGVEYKMPSGKALTSDIAYVLRFKEDTFGTISFRDDEIFNAVRHYTTNKKLGDIADFARASINIKNGMHEAPSIDQFIHMRRADHRIELMGKIAIVRCILNFEEGSHLHYVRKRDDETINFNKISDTWLPKFKEFVTTGYQKDEIAKQFEKLTLIIFNYDRCIEHYLLHSLRSTYGIDDKESAGIPNSLAIIHPYGVVGDLPWQAGNKNVEFGETSLYGRLVDLADGIRTFTEQAADEGVHERIHSAMQQSELVLFLGFAYHDQNVGLLNTDAPVGIRKVYGTTCGFSDDDRKIIRGTLAHAICQGNHNKITLRSDLECREFFAEYSKTFSKA